MEYKLRVQVTLSWFDPRITFRNLKENERDNILNDSEKSKIWLPTLIFTNSNFGQRTLADNESSLIIKRLGKPTKNPINEIYEDYLYKGAENPLVLSRFYTATLQCAFQLRVSRDWSKKTGQAQNLNID